MFYCFDSIVGLAPDLGHFRHSGLYCTYCPFLRRFVAVRNFRWGRHTKPSSCSIVVDHDVNAHVFIAQEYLNLAEFSLIIDIQVRSPCLGKERN